YIITYFFKKGSLQMIVNYKIYNPGGNVTALITDTNLTKEQYQSAGRKIMEQNKKVEQFGYVENITTDTCKFQTAGGSFCGNTARCAAFYMAKDKNFNKGTLLLNQMKMGFVVETDISMITVKEKDLIKKYEYNNNIKRFVAQFNGVTCVITESLSDKDKFKEIKENVLKEYPLTPAVCVIYFDANTKKITPYSYIKETDTFINETASVSSSITAALSLRDTRMLKNQNFSVAINQPSGHIYQIYFQDGNVIIGGLIEPVGEKTIEL
ncbi:MAG: hypothetical protein FWD32_01930, partial [Firmicutes bacterium]|nr:hypothetical protein [Bacillota bacterium]